MIANLLSDSFNVANSLRVRSHEMRNELIPA